MNTSGRTPTFPTAAHSETAETIRDFFSKRKEVDTILVVNSCARGQAVPESDLDLAILVNEDLTSDQAIDLESQWDTFFGNSSAIASFRRQSKYHTVHLDIINGVYAPTIVELGAPSDYFELEIGNHICYSAVFGTQGPYFKKLQDHWLPYYSSELTAQRLSMLKESCSYDIEHIPHYVRRGLCFQALDVLSMAFRKYLQALFVGRQTYPIAYNKWIKYQIVDILGLPELYQVLTKVLSVSDIESDELIQRAHLLNRLLAEIPEPNKVFNPTAPFGT